MNEYEARVKSFANGVAEIRDTTGATSSTLMFALMSIMLAKNKITDKDLDIIISVEKEQARSSMKSYFEQGYGNPDFEIQNEEELKLAETYLIEHIENIATQIKSAAAQLKPKRKSNEKQGQEI